MTFLLLNFYALQHFDEFRLDATEIFRRGFK